MNDVLHSLTSHPLALLAMAAAGLLVVYCILKQLLRLALVCGLVLIGIGGYYYFTAPAEFPAKAEQTVKEVTDTTRGVYDQGKAVLEQSRKLQEKIAGRLEGQEK